MPAQMAAEEEPRPRPCGMRLAQTTSRPRGCPPSRSKAVRRERTSRWLSSRGSVVGALTRDVDVQTGVGDPDDDVVVQPQGQAEGVEARAEIGAGGGDAHPDGGGAERWTGHRSMTLLVTAARLSYEVLRMYCESVRTPVGR